MGGGGGLTGGSQNVVLLDGIRCDKFVSQRFLWAILSPNDNPSDTGVSVLTPKYSEDSSVRVLTLEYTDEGGSDSGVSVLTFEYSDDSRDRSRDNVLTFEYMDDTCSDSGVSVLTLEYTGDAGSDCGVVGPSCKRSCCFPNSGSIRSCMCSATGGGGGGGLCQRHPYP